eukprot:PITA_29225
MDLERVDAAGFRNVVAASRKTSENEDPLPFLRNANSSRFGREVVIQPTKKRAAQTCGGPLDKIFQHEKRDEVDLTMTFFFYLNFISFNVARSPWFIEMCRALVDMAPIGYVPPNGWTDTTRHPLINFMVYSQNGPVFLKAVDALGQYKDAQYMDVTWIGNLIEDARHIRNFVQNHTNALTIYKEYTHLSLLKIVDTRFASSFIMLKRLKEVKAALRAMVISDPSSFWRRTDQTASKKVKDIVLDDGWWERVDLTIKIMNPIISFLRFADTDHPILGEVYEGWDSMIESVKTIVMENECPGYETSAESLWSTIQDILISRWDKNCTLLHCLTYSLNPK